MFGVRFVCGVVCGGDWEGVWKQGSWRDMGELFCSWPDRQLVALYVLQPSGVLLCCMLPTLNAAKVVSWCWDGRLSVGCHNPWRVSCKECMGRTERPPDNTALGTSAVGAEVMLQCCTAGR